MLSVTPATAMYAAAAVVLCAGLMVGIVRRYSYLRRPRYNPISPRELKQRLEAGERIVVIDLRHPLDYMVEPCTIPGAVRVTENCGEGCAHCAHSRDCTVVFYGTCMNEKTATRAAAKLARQGFTRLRPLEGGLPAWRECGFPLELTEEMRNYLASKAPVVTQRAFTASNSR